MLVALGDRVEGCSPLVARAPRPADAVQPSLYRAIVILDTVVTCRNELEVLVVGDLVYAGSTADRAVARAQVDLNVHHVVLLNVFRLIVLCAVKDEIPWLHLIEV